MTQEANMTQGVTNDPRSYLWPKESLMTQGVPKDPIKTQGVTHGPRSHS